jgi:predicted nucleic acid-binding protein
MLVDTDVLIWHLRGLPNATQRLDQLSNLTISAITYLELLQGMGNWDAHNFRLPGCNLKRSLSRTANASRLQ